MQQSDTRKAQMRERQAIRRAEWTSKGLCIQCGGTRKEGYHDANVQKRADRRAKGVCSKCAGKWGPPIAGETLCEHCKASTYVSMAKTRDRRIRAKKEKRAHHKSQGICMTCGLRPVEDDKVQCKKCRLRPRFGVLSSPEEIAEVLKITDCPICLGEATCIDHDHATGAVRGRICGPCNFGIGNFKDDPATLKRAAEYLENPPWPPKQDTT
jgi:Recombination endonuclease VII